MPSWIRCRSLLCAHAPAHNYIRASIDANGRHRYAHASSEERARGFSSELRRASRHHLGRCIETAEFRVRALRKPKSGSFLVVEEVRLVGPSGTQPSLDKVQSRGGFLFGCGCLGRLTLRLFHTGSRGLALD